MSVRLKGRNKQAEAQTHIGQTLLEIALQHKVDWNFQCERGSCSRCRCLVEQGGALLSELSDEEWDSLDDEEIRQGYRLACQARIERDGEIIALNKPYF